MVEFYKKYGSYVLNNKLRKGKLDYLIFFVTSRCDASCPNCFYRNSLGKYVDLSLGEVEKISKGLGEFHILLISGGEPFLRLDLDKLLKIFIKNNNVKIINIPTNGLATDRIIAMVEKILKQNKGINLSINPSLDGLYEVNDKLRTENGFVRTIETIRQLEKLKEKYDNLEIVVNTVISKYNYRNIFSLMSYMRGFNINSHNFELIRDKDLLPSMDEIKRIHHSVLVNREKYLGGFIEKFIVIGSLAYIHRIKEQALEGKSFGCIAIHGGALKVLDSNGKIRRCELLADEQITKNCACTHVCFIQATIASQFKTFFKIPYYYLKYNFVQMLKWR